MKAFTIVFFLLYTPFALAHSWYEWECCAGNDCSPVPVEAIRAGKGGYSVTLQPGEHPLVKEAPVSGLVPYSETRVSQDSEFHVCIVAGAIKCLYAPQGGV